ncbi:MAG: hypothetical protein ACOCYW_06610 [Roseicyclus sp.]
MKTSPAFETMENGKGLRFSVNTPTASYSVVLSREFLDDEVGDASSTADRRAWVEENLDEILNAAEAKRKRRPVRAPFDRVMIGSEE